MDLKDMKKTGQNLPMMMLSQALIFTKWKENSYARSGRYRVGSFVGHLDFRP
jgi:hypothetical protein